MGLTWLPKRPSRLKRLVEKTQSSYWKQEKAHRYTAKNIAAGAEAIDNIAYRPFFRALSQLRHFSRSHISPCRIICSRSSSRSTDLVISPKRDFYDQAN